MRTKLYLYGVVRLAEDTSLGSAGLSTNGAPDEIKVKSDGRLGVVYSPKELDDEEMLASRKNLLNHQKAIEKVMEDHTVLPFSFGTIVDDFQAIESLLTTKQKEFEQSMDKIEGKIELSLKVLWEDMDIVFKQVIEQDEEIRRMRDGLASQAVPDQNDKILLGEMVERALNQRKDYIKEEVIAALTPYAEQVKEQKNITEAMCVNAAFLVDKERETAFDDIVSALGDRFSDNVLFKYVGPMAPFNFI